MQSQTVSIQADLLSAPAVRRLTYALWMHAHRACSV